MNVQIIRIGESQYGDCIVTPESGDPTFYKESRLLYHIKNTLNAQGYDLIKKRMHKDGHMFGAEETQYIRTRKPSSNPELDIYIYDANWMLRNFATEYRKRGKLILEVVFDVFNVKED